MASNEETNAAGTDTRPPMLVESDYESWKIRIHRYIRGKPNGKLIWKSIQNGPTPHPMITDPPTTDSAAVFPDISSTNQSNKHAKEIWDTWRCSWHRIVVSKSSFHPPTTSSGLPPTQGLMLRCMMVRLLLNQFRGRLLVIMVNTGTRGHLEGDMLQPAEPSRTLLIGRFLSRNLSGNQAYWLCCHRFASQAQLNQHTCLVPSLLEDYQAEKPMLTGTQVVDLTSETPKRVCSGLYNVGVKPTSGASKTVPKRAPRNHSSLPVKSANARKVEAHHRTLNKKNRVDSNLLVKHSVSVSKMNNVCGACNKSLVSANHTDCLVMCDGSVNVKPHQTKRFKRQPRKEWKPVKKVWKPISKPVANSKPQWKPTGRHFSLFEKHPLTRIMESTDQPIELPPSASSSPKITMVSRFADHKVSDRQAGSKGISVWSVLIVLWYLDSGCSRHMTGDRARLINFVEKFFGTVRLALLIYAAIIGYG
ncbi:hypothetical protein Tco_1509266 [Tanacetum coccineum]